MLTISPKTVNAQTAESRTSRKLFTTLVVDADSDCRAATEQFIANGYAKSYQATITAFMPLLLSMTNGKWQAALGIRAASSKLEPLFIEQYLSAPIEQYLTTSQQHISRDEIAEIGNLYSNHHQLTMPLFMVMAVSLYMSGYQMLAFAATDKVRALLQGAGLALTTITSAEQGQLHCDSDSWGNYYQTQPQVVTLELPQVMAVIADNPRYNKLLESMSSDIALVVAALRSSVAEAA